MLSPGGVAHTIDMYFSPLLSTPSQHIEHLVKQCMGRYDQLVNGISDTLGMMLSLGGVWHTPCSRCVHTIEMHFSPFHNISNTDFLL